MKILFLVPYPINESPSQRFRFEQYFGALIEQGHTFYTQSFLTQTNWKTFFKKGNLVSKTIGLASGFFKRVFILFKLSAFDFVFIHREAAPIGGPFFEWVISKVLGKKIIYDFDDAIWLTDRNEESLLLRTLKWRSKVKSICRWSYKISCGNNYLCNYASQFNNRVFYNPTTIETELMHNPNLYEKSTSNRITIGWTGSHSTLKYLHSIEPALQFIEKKYLNVDFNVISDVSPQLNLKRLNFIAWTVATEINDLIRFDIGVMPLPDDEWAKGKCGFKALQYMSLQIPTVASPVGVNSHIMEHGKTGFLCETIAEWQHQLARLIEDSDLREKIGEASREKIIQFYSVKSNAHNFLNLFD